MGRDPGHELDKAKRSAQRRANVGRRARRLLPSMVVGSGALIGTGGLMVWVGGQPGLTSSSPAGTAVPQPTADQTNTPVLRQLNDQLKIDNGEVQQLQSALTKLGAARRAAADNHQVTTIVGGQATGGGSAPSGSGGPSPLAPIASIGSVNVPAIQPIAIPAPSAAPATNATTGASHVVP